MFVDAQNLFNAAKRAFGYSYPNFEADRLGREVCWRAGWIMRGCRIYTGLPEAGDPRREFWIRKLQVLGTRGVVVTSRPLRYRTQSVRLADGRWVTVRVGQEKGIDVRIALDVVRHAVEGDFDIAVIMSQDQDLAEVVGELHHLSVRLARPLIAACAFPVGGRAGKERGLQGAIPLPIDRSLYDSCIDPGRYRDI